MIAARDAWGPFARDLDPAERRARLRSLRQTARLLIGPRGVDLCRLLAQAEADARRIATRISRRDKAPLLPTYRHRRPWHTAGPRTPDAAA